MRRAQMPSLPTGGTLRDALAVIDRHAAAICLVVDEDERLVGTLSDGDARRALLAGASIDGPALPWANERPHTVPQGTDRADILDLMQSLRLTQIPELDLDGRVSRLHLLRDIVGGVARTNTAVILAGGRGTRLHPVTEHVPKPMVTVAGRPILERIVLHLVSSGVTDIRLAVGYLAEQIEQHFEDGARFGCRITYLREREPRGTAGPLRDLLPSLPSDPILVLNGDLLTSFSVESLLSAHEASGSALTVAVTDYFHEVPYGVVATRDDGERIASLEEKPTWSGLVNAGVYVVDPRLVSGIEPSRSVPMTEVVENALHRGDIVTAWRMSGDWHDIGRPDDLARARGHA